jgi:hypothetical protein
LEQIIEFLLELLGTDHQQKRSHAGQSKNNHPTTYLYSLKKQFEMSSPSRCQLPQFINNLNDVLIPVFSTPAPSQILHIPAVLTQLLLQYDSSFGKKKTAEDDKSATSRIASKYGAYGSGYQRDTSASGTVYQDNSMSPNRGEITTRFFL